MASSLLVYSFLFSAVFFCNSSCQSLEVVLEARLNVIRSTEDVIELIRETNDLLERLRDAVDDVNIAEKVRIAAATLNGEEPGTDLRVFSRTTKSKFTRLQSQLTQLTPKSRDLPDGLSAIVQELRDTQLTECHQQQENEGYYFGEGMGCYYFGAAHKNWDSARSACQSRGMDLAAVTSHEQQEFLESVIDQRTDSTQEYWLSGRRDNTHEFVWFSLQGLPVSQAFTHWHSGEPNDFLFREDCLAIWHQLRWNDYSCGRELPFICQDIF